jgi:hypothetical protein
VLNEQPQQSQHETADWMFGQERIFPAMTLNGSPGVDTIKLRLEVTTGPRQTMLDENRRFHEFVLSFAEISILSDKGFCNR